jgi:hypothetical protein
MHQALVEGIVVPEGLLVPSMTAVRCEADVRRLMCVTADVVAFVERVSNANVLLAQVALKRKSHEQTKAIRGHHAY